jgi:PIN domain nuclease of toxin-antitoxin system
MTDKIVFDASAILALLKMEQGHEIVAENLDRAIVSSVNFSEVVTVLARKGFGQEEVIRSLKETFLYIEEFDTEQAVIAASLDEATKENGLSFGDRACLALAKAKNLPVLTADKVWKELDLSFKIQLIR